MEPGDQPTWLSIENGFAVIYIWKIYEIYIYISNSLRIKMENCKFSLNFTFCYTCSLAIENKELKFTFFWNSQVTGVMDCMYFVNDMPKIRYQVIKILGFFMYEDKNFSSKPCHT